MTEYPCPQCASTNTVRETGGRHGSTGDRICNACNFIGHGPDFKPLTFTLSTRHRRVLQSLFIDLLTLQTPEAKTFALHRQSRRMVEEFETLAQGKGWTTNG